MAEERGKELEFIKNCADMIIKYLQEKLSTIRREGMGEIEKQILQGEFRIIIKHYRKAFDAWLPTI